MKPTKDKLKKIGYQILSDLGVEDYYKDREPTIGEREILVYKTTSSYAKEKGWRFIVSAPNWQFNNDQGVYGISFLLDGTPHRITDGTGGRGMSAFITKDENGNYKAVATVEEI